MAAIGEVSCSFVRGVSPGLRPRVRIWSTPGQSGYGAITMASGNADFRFVAVFYGTAAAAETWKANILALIATSVTITDSEGLSHTNCLIQSADPSPPTGAIQTGIDTRMEIAIIGVKTA